MVATHIGLNGQSAPQLVEKVPERVQGTAQIQNQWEEGKTAMILDHHKNKRHATFQNAINVSFHSFTTKVAYYCYRSLDLSFRLLANVTKISMIILGDSLEKRIVRAPFWEKFVNSRSFIILQNWRQIKNLKH